MNNEKWLQTIEMANIVPNPNISTGCIKNVIVRKNIWTLFLFFENAIIWSELKDMMTKIRKAYLAKFTIDDVKFNISYRNIDFNQVFISEYYMAAIEEISKDIITIKMLNKYSYLIDGNKVNIKVASELDRNNVLEHLPLVREFFQNYGINNIIMKCEISEDEVNLQIVHQEQKRILESRNEARMMEEYYRRKAENNANITRTSFEPRGNNQLITITLKEIPTTSIDVEMFRQTKGTVRVEFSAVVAKSECKFLKAKTGKEFNLCEAIVTDYEDAILIKRFFNESDRDFFENKIKEGIRIVVKGKIQWDDFVHDVVVMCDNIDVCGPDVSRERFDVAEEKRIELHAHTKMSVLDSVLSIDEYINTAVNFGHKALAVTDHANCHILPEFFKKAKKANIKPIAGLEGYYVDNNKFKIALTDHNCSLSDATFVVFDIETTGLCINFHEIIEIGAVKVKSGLIVDTFAEFVKPSTKITPFITKLTDISNEMVETADIPENVLRRFQLFIDGSILVAHNATFDTDFIYAKMKEFKLIQEKLPCIDTMQLARALYTSELKYFNLKAVAKYLKVNIEQQHRAIHDARTTNNFFGVMLTDLINRNISDYQMINSIIDENFFARTVIPTHITILVKNKIGLKNFYKIISDSHTTHFQKEARITRDVLMSHREGLLIGSSCSNGEIFRTALEKTYDQLLAKVAFYDYIELQPLECYKYIFEESDPENGERYIRDTIELIVKAANEKNILVVATGDVHELNVEDAKYRQIYLAVARPNGGGPHMLANYQPLDMHFRTTNEMLDAFDFLGKDYANEIVIKNTNFINDQIEEYDLFPPNLYVPRDDSFIKIGIKSMKEEVNNISYQKARELYGNQLPIYVERRLKRELDSIIGNGFSSVYYISHLLVKKSNDAGYVVGSRGSVGSSFVATLMGITEVNPLKPHYRCPNCQYSVFKFTKKEQEEFQQTVTDEINHKLEKVLVGMDLEDEICPHCQTELLKEGIDIAFETFMGFSGEKVPDIDLNFSGEYQSIAHDYCQEIFGIDNAFRAGTISTVMDKTAFAYVRDYYEGRGIPIRKQHIESIAKFISGSKRTTGQHPGGIIVIPDNIEYTDIIPVQYPPVDDSDNGGIARWRTSHYDYHSFESNLLKLDILGHDDPTVIKTLMSYVRDEPENFPFNSVETIPYIDDDVLSLFSSKRALQYDGDDLDNFSSGTIGIPEFGTSFVRGMLEIIKPHKYTDIIKVSGLSHGTDVWAKNAEDLFKGIIPSYPKVPFSEVIGCRDDIMIYLLEKNLPARDAFQIMESVRKGNKLKPEQEKLMREHQVPEWYIYSCNKIKYMFPKAHATAYVIMALRIGWFKVHRPIYYYAAYFSIRAKELDAEVFALGKNAIRNRIIDIEKRIKERQKVTNKEIVLVDELHIALEMILRGYSFLQIDLQKSDARNFIISDDHKSLYLPFIAIESLGDAVADSIVVARGEAPFSSMADFEQRTRINKTQYARLKTLGVFDNLPENDTLL